MVATTAGAAGGGIWAGITIGDAAGAGRAIPVLASGALHCRQHMNLALRIAVAACRRITADMKSRHEKPGLDAIPFGAGLVSQQCQPLTADAVRRQVVTFGARGASSIIWAGVAVCNAVGA